MKRCYKCGESKPLDQFHRNKSRPDGYAHRCKDCTRAYDREKYLKDPARRKAQRDKWFRENPNKVRASHAKWRRENPEKHAEWNRKNRERVFDSRLRNLYGITAAQYYDMLTAQGGGCAICGEPPPEGGRLEIDHDHSCCPERARSCGKCVRGLLCNQHNRMLSNADDEVAILRRAIEYLGGQ